MAENGDQNQAEVLDPAPVPAPPSPRVRLAKVRDCRREMVRVYVEARAGKLDSQVATRLTYMLQAIVGMIRDHDLEERIAKLEQAAEDGAIQETMR